MNPFRRPAFTLLEVMLATAIGVLLMGALYVAMNVLLGHTQAGRETVERSQLVRALFARIAGDIAPSLAPAVVPQATSSASSQTTTSTTTSQTQTAPAGGTGAGTGSTTTTSTTTTTTTSTQSSTVGSNGFNLGVQGDATRLTLFVARVPREIAVQADVEVLPIVSDLRRITYWLVGGVDAPLGLARQEMKVATAEDETSLLPPDVPDESIYLVAEEVKSLEFAYWNGTEWQDTWDGSQLGQDGTSPIGPPRAIAITIGVASGGSTTLATTPAALTVRRHVVAITTANGTTQSVLPTTTE